MNDDKMMIQALKLAKKAEKKGEVPVGALVFFKGKIIGKGYNQKECKKDPLAHAEIIALKKAAHYLGQWRLCECVLIVTLEPCIMCLATCQQARIKKIIYGAVDSKGGAISLGYRFFEDKRLNHQITISHQPLTECGKILTKFFIKKRLSKKSEKNPDRTLFTLLQ